ncbi:hypothetical protein ABPG74_003607 [Tetrahymena malaccensis]
MIYKIIFLLGIIISSSFCSYGYIQNQLENKLLKEKINIQFIKDVFFYSKASYCSFENLQTWRCGDDCLHNPHMQHIRVFENKEKNSQGFCGYNPVQNQIVIAIRGTDNLNNWITNLKAFPVDFPSCVECQIHMGFRDHAQSVQEDINLCVKSILKQYINAKIVITGHSLGGAIATLVSIEVLKYLKTKDQVSVYTFGAPKIGNQNFVDYLNQQIPNSYRIVNYYDAVPHLPFKQILDFKHHGYEIWMTNPDSLNQFKVCHSQQLEHQGCSSQVSLLNFSIKNHISYFGIYTGCTKDLYQKEFLEHQNEELQKYLNKIYQQLEKQV